MKTLRLKRNKDAPIKRRSPFIFSGAVEHVEEGVTDGDPVRVCAHNGQPLAVGHYQADGSIRARVLAFSDRPIDAAFWTEALTNAWQLRRQLGLADAADTNAFRLVHGEGDGLPGLVIDCYAGHAVIEPHSSGMAREAGNAITTALRSVAGDRLTSISIRARNAAPVDGPTECEITENGLRFGVDWHRGQKTGFYIDQRENRKLIRAYAANRQVLNLFSYSGGFSVYALQAGATQVLSVDASALAVEWASQNVARNGLPVDRHATETADVFEHLKGSEAMWDTIVCDPPAFAKHMSARHEAIQAYRRLNALALRRLVPGGVLFTFSCSQVVTPDLFRGAILAAAIDVGRPVRILHQLHQPPDHPVSIYHPESEYLKGFVLHVT